MFHDLRAELNSTIRAEIGKVSKIFHLAANSHVNRSIADPLSCIFDNVIGTTNLFNYAKSLYELELCQLFSTDEVYGNANPETYFLEWDRHKPGSIYSASKSACDQLAQAYFNTWKTPIIISNCMNIVGQRQHAEKFLPLVIKKVLAGETVKIHVDEHNNPGVRGYVHARNVAAACLFLSEHFEPGERYNFPGQVYLNNLEFAQRVADILNRPLHYELIAFDPDRPGHDIRYALDGSKMSGLGFKYPISFEQSLADTIWWTATNRRWLS